MKHVLAYPFLLTLLLAAGCGGENDPVKPAVDTEKPVVTITQPAESVPVTAGAVIIRARATDNRGVARVEFFVNDTGIGSDATGVQEVYEYRWSATPGAHELRAVAFDAAGNTGSDTLQVACIAPDIQGPAVTIIEPQQGATLDEGIVAIRATATDDSGVTNVEFFDNDALIGADSSGASGVYDVDWTATSGAHVLRAVALDAAGNPGSDTVQVVCVASDVQGPDVTIVQPAEGAIEVGTVAIRATASDESGVARVEFFDDAVKIGEDSVAVGGVYERDWVAETGYHLLRVVAQDAFGNASADSAGVSVGAVWNLQVDPAVFCPDSTGTSVRFAIQEPCLLEIRITIPGTPTVVRSLVDEQVARGVHAVTWDGRDDLGQRLPDGPYTCGMSATFGGGWGLFPASTVTLDCSVP